MDCAQDKGMPVQIEADPRPTGTDARAIQIARGRCSHWVGRNPLRYMHTPSEVIDLNDLEAVVQLLVSFARSFAEL